MRLFVLLMMMGLIMTPITKAADPPAAGGSGIARSIDSFGIDLYRRLPANENLFFSPASISTAFAMAYAGAKGETASEIARVMHFDVPADKLGTDSASLIQLLNGKGDKRGYELAMANAMWGQKSFPFSPDYQAMLSKDFEAALRTLNFAQPEPARQEINRWVSDQTRGKIEDLIPQGGVTAATRLVLTNAVYFKAQWQHQFKSESTKPGPFKIGGSKVEPVPMMHQSDQFHFVKGDGMSAIELPYAGGTLSMLVFLPDNPTGLADVEKKLDYATLNQWITHLQSQRPTEVIVSFPKFKMTRELELGKTLAAMGMSLPFSSDADFSGMTTGGQRILISEAFHKAFVDVNEEGTEAAAATGLVMRATAMQAAPPVFNADHPFLFVIRENQSGTILFIGRVMDPRS